MKSYKDTNKSAFDASGYNILVVSATGVETNAFHDVMPDEIVKIICGDYTYYFGHVGCYDIIHVQCSEMGSLNPGGSAQTVSAALKEWPQIKGVIMMGICFGFDPSKQQIGDVVVATSIKNYETRRVGKECEIPRGKSYQPDKCLLNAFNTLQQTWEYIDDDNQKKNLVLGEYVSGEQLVDNIDARDKLLKETPEAKAGEMEGNGLVGTCESSRIPWILVKAICDFADGNKAVDKKRRQAIAAASSASCCEAALGQATAFEAIGIKSCQQRVAVNHQENTGVLFEIYKKELAPFFLRRSVDTTVEDYLTSHSLWVYGSSGVGKSTSILHALMSMGKEVLLINLAGISKNSSLEDIFQWIYYDVANYVKETAVAPQHYQLCARRIETMLNQYFTGKSVYVLVEEIPFEGESFKTFVTSFASMVITNGLSGSSSDLHFVLSSIENPVPYLSGSLMKTKSMIKFLEFNQWTKKECQELIDLIGANISVPQIKDTDDLIAKCDHSPRSIKTVFREAYQTHKSGNLNPEDVEMILQRYL